MCHDCHSCLSFVSLQIASIAATLIIFATIGLSSYMYPEMYSSTWKTWFISCMFTPISFVIAYVIAFAMRMPDKLRRTLGITTGTKSLALCLTIIAISFPRDEYLKYLVFPELHSIIMLIELAAYCAGYRLFLLLKKKYFTAHAQTDNETRENGNCVSNENGLTQHLEQTNGEFVNGHVNILMQDVHTTASKQNDKMR